MSLLNPFFRQQVQDPGMSTNAGPVVDTWTNELKMKNELLQEQMNLVGESLESFAIVAKAKDQLKDAERELDLKDFRVSLNEEGTSIHKGFQSNSSIGLKGEEILKVPKTGQYKYSDIDEYKKTVRNNLFGKYKKDKRFDWDDSRFKRQAEAELDVLVENNFKSVDDLLRTRLSHRTLKSIKEQGYLISNQIINGDYSGVNSLDKTIEGHVLKGNISELEAMKFRSEWRRGVWSTIATQLNSNQMNSNGNEGRKSYEEWYKNALKIKSKKGWENAKYDVKTEEEFNKKDQKITYEEYLSNYNKLFFIKDMPIRDIISINASVKGIHTVNLDTQKTTLDILFKEEPIKSLSDFGLQLAHKYDSEGKIIDVTVVSAKNIGKDKIADHINGILKEKKFPLLKSEDVIKLAESFAGKHKKRLSANEGAGDLTKKRKLFNADIDYFFGNWNSRIQELLSGSTNEEIATVEPDLPWDTAGHTNADWAEDHHGIIEEMKQTLIVSNGILGDITVLLSDLNKKDGSVNKNNTELGTGIKDRIISIKKAISNLPIAEDYLGRYGAREALYKFLAPVESKVDAYIAVEGNSGKGPNKLDQHGASKAFRKDSDGNVILDPILATEVLIKLMD